MVDATLFSENIRQLIIDQNQIFLNSSKADYTLAISLINQQCLKRDNKNFKYAKIMRNIVAVYGIIQMEVNKYLVVVTKADVVGQIFKKIIYSVEKLEFICLSTHENQRDLPYIEGLAKVLDSKSLYFSQQYDLTQPFQKFIQGKGSLANKRNEYMYNQEWTRDFMSIDAIEWVTSFISGYVDIRFIQLSNDKTADLCMISRRDKRRQGIRYFTRGIDSNGCVANASQIETILSINQNSNQEYYSFIQLRGSMPFYWRQRPNFKLKPTPHIIGDEEYNKKAFSKFYEYLRREYGEGTLVNLVDKQGFQKQLGQYFQNLNYALQNHWRFVWFDFHTECKNMKFENVAKLIDMIEGQLLDYGYFHLKQSHEEQDRIFVELKTQTGIIRTNCVDSLDRTNVVQSAIARTMLIKWLSKIQVIPQKHGLVLNDNLPANVDKIFREQWAENADILSRLYSGTEAMKTDYTYTGKRTVKGVLKDAKIGVQRYFLGNFYDSQKQDYVHFSLGQIKPKEKQFQKIRHSNFNSLYFLTLIAISIPLIVNVAVDKNSSQQSETLWTKIGLTFAGYIILATGMRLFNRLLVRTPIPIQE